MYWARRQRQGAPLRSTDDTTIFPPSISHSKVLKLLSASPAAPRNYWTLTCWTGFVLSLSKDFLGLNCQVNYLSCLSRGMGTGIIFPRHSILLLIRDLSGQLSSMRWRNLRRHIRAQWKKYRLAVR